MKNIFTFCLIIILSSSVSFADEDKGLKKNANAIIENYHVELTILNQEKALLKIKIENLILNKNGNKHALFAEYYDKFRKIKSFDGKILDSNNKIIKKISFRDLNDQSLINDFSLYEDNRIKYYEPQQKNYPYRVVYNYVIEYNGTFNLPVWQPLKSSHLSVKHASLKVIQPQNNSIRYKLIQVKEPEIQIIKDQLIYNWKVENLEARKSEPLKLPYSLTTPTVYLAPNNFSIDGFNGCMNSWEKFGKWRYNLIKNQSTLPEEAILDIKNLIEGKTNKFEIAKKIYEYMQSRTRYVSIQEGIGGWQPIDATTIHNLGYGDCKALTNYTKSLLEVAGIESHYAVVRAGINEYDIQTDFPSNQFNHVILCIPIDKDTVWLECTSQFAPFGYLGDFTGNKHALLITANGGKIVKTTKYAKKDNVQNRHIIVNLREDGQASSIIKTIYRGLQYENISYYTEKNKEDQKEFLLKKLDINNFTIEGFKINCKKGIYPEAYDSIHLTINNYANISSKRMFFALNMLNKNEYIPIKLDQRISPIRFTFPYTDIDSIEYYIPENYIIEYIPENFSLKNQFGDYSVEFIVNQNKIVFIRKLSVNKDIFSPECYNDLIIFFEEITKHDKSKCVLKKDS